jgi:hypothetical protein
MARCDVCENDYAKTMTITMRIFCCGIRRARGRASPEGERLSAAMAIATGTQSPPAG